MAPIKMISIKDTKPSLKANIRRSLFSTPKRYS